MAHLLTRLLSLAVLLATVSSHVIAQPLRYTVDGRFRDGGTLMGFFDYDRTITSMTAVKLESRSFSGVLLATYSTPAVGQFLGTGTGFALIPEIYDRTLYLVFEEAPRTFSGGALLRDPLGCAPLQCVSAGELVQPVGDVGFRFRPLDGGTATAVVAPEPASAALLLVGTVALAVVARRRRA